MDALCNTPEFWSLCISVSDSLPLFGQCGRINPPAINTALRTFQRAHGAVSRLAQHFLRPTSNHHNRHPSIHPRNLTTGGIGDADVAPAFPNLPEETLPPEPIAMHMTPDGSAWWIAGMSGYIKMVGFVSKVSLHLSWFLSSPLSLGPREINNPNNPSRFGGCVGDLNNPLVMRLIGRSALTHFILSGGRTRPVRRRGRPGPVGQGRVLLRAGERDGAKQGRGFVLGGPVKGFCSGVCSACTNSEGKFHRR